jgi:hypothetical protein
MKFAFRWAFRLFVVGVVLLVALLLLKDTLVKSLAQRRIRSQTGLEVRIGKFETRLLTPTVTIENFKLYNSAEFGGSVFIDMPELHLEYDPAAMASRKLHFTLVRFSLADVGVVENKDGLSNLESIKSELEKKTGKAGKDREKDKAQIEFSGIDTLDLTVGKVNFTSLKNPKSNRTFNIGLKNRILKNVRSEADVASLLMEIVIKQGLDLLNPKLGLPTNSIQLPESPLSVPKDHKKASETAPAVGTRAE